MYHVGRAGDIPGGMTQVINAYLAWPFEHVTVHVIESRGDPGDHLTALRRVSGALRRVRTIAKHREDAVIVVHLSERGSFVREGAIARYAARLGLPVVAHLHGSEFAAYESENPLAVDRVLKACAEVITLSEESSRISAQHVGEARVQLVPNAIPAGREAPKERTVVFGGVVSRRKGIDVLQDAWRAVSDDFPEWRLLIAGPIRDDHLVDTSLPRAEFLGSVGHDDLMTLLQSASVAVLPSRDEAMPMFILEALARHACVISTTVGGIPLLLADDCGELVAAGDATALTAALRRVLGDAQHRERLATRGNERFQNGYSAQAVFPRVEAIWLAARSASSHSATDTTAA